MSISRRDILSAMSAKTGFTKTSCEQALNAFSEVLHAWVLEGHVGDRVNIKGVGSLIMEERPGKENYYNPLTKQMVDIPPRRAIKFALSPSVKAEYIAEAPTILRDE